MGGGSGGGRSWKSDAVGGGLGGGLGVGVMVGALAVAVVECVGVGVVGMGFILLFDVCVFCCCEIDGVTV